MLTAGGFVDFFNLVTSSAELYDQNTGTWSNSAALNSARRFHTATQLQTGKVLVAGGSTALNSAELWIPGPNPIDDARFFVRQQYLDFLSREPDQDGWDYWTLQISSCPEGDRACVTARRIAVSNAIFFEPEFQESGGYVYRVYKAAFGLNPTFAQFQPDRAQVVGGANLEQSKIDFVADFVQRQPFLELYPRSQTAAQFVDQLLASIMQHSSLNLTQLRSDLISLYDGTDQGRAAILRRIVDNRDFIDAEYNPSFVFTEYFGYLRRGPDPGGYTFWLNQVNRFPLRDIGVQHALVCSFITSFEYQLRFGIVVEHSNFECPQ